jgi:hypothetical protein
LVVVLASVAAFFAWANGATRSRHARFTREDVQSAIENVLGLHGDLHDEWDLFMARPIDDLYLESVRQRCLRIWEELGPEPIGPRLRRELEDIHQEIRGRAYRP